MIRERRLEEQARDSGRMRFRARSFLEFQEKNQTRLILGDKVEADPGRKQDTVSPALVLGRIRWVRGRKIQHIHRIWSEKHWAATPVSHRDFSAFALQRAAKTISNFTAISRTKSLAVGLCGRLGLTADQGCPEGWRLNEQALPRTLRNATRIQTPGSAQVMWAVGLGPQLSQGQS